MLTLPDCVIALCRRDFLAAVAGTRAKIRVEEIGMPSDKVAHEFEIESEQREWLEEVADEYDFQDESKALRVLLDFAIQDADKDTIFADENMRCRFCG